MVQTKNKPPGFLWKNQWADFLQSHHDWWENISADNPAVYAMTECLIGSLRDGSNPFLSEADENAERAFLRVCAFHNDVVGVRNHGEPIAYLLWDPDDLACSECTRPPCEIDVFPVAQGDRDHFHNVEIQLRNLQEELKVLLNQTPIDRDQIRNVGTQFHQIDKDQLWGFINHRANLFMENVTSALQTRAMTIRRNQLRHAGFLLQHPEYRENIHRFVERSQVFDQVDLFQLICGKRFSLPGMRGRSHEIIQGDPPFAHFFEDLSQFAARWCIAGFTTWDLPVIQIPLEGFPVEVLALLRGAGAIVSHCPVYFDTEFADRQSLRAQEATDLGFPLDSQRRTLTRTSLNSGEESLFRMFLLETAVKQRFPNPRRGLINRILKAFTTHFECRERYVNRLRGRYIIRP